MASRFTDRTAQGIGASSSVVAQLFAIKAGKIITGSGFVSRAVTASAGTGLAIIIDIERFRSDADV